MALAVCGAVALWWLSPSSQVSPVELGRRSRGNGARWTCRESFALAFSSPKRKRERKETALAMRTLVLLLLATSLVLGEVSIS